MIGPATCFPVSMARGATFDPDLEERIGRGDLFCNLKIFDR